MRRGSEGEKPEAAVTESEAGGGAKPWLPLPMGQLAQPFPAYLAQLPLGVTLPRLDPGSLNSIALKSLWAGMQLLAAHRRSCGQPSSHQTSRRDTAGRTKKIGHDGETKSDGHRVRRTHHPQVADRPWTSGLRTYTRCSVSFRVAYSHFPLHPKRIGRDRPGQSIVANRTL